MQASKTLNRDPVLDVEGDSGSTKPWTRKALAALAVLAVAVLALIAAIVVNGDDSPSRDQSPSVSTSVVSSGSPVADAPAADHLPSSEPAVVPPAPSVDAPSNADWTTPAD